MKISYGLILIAMVVVAIAIIIIYGISTIDKVNKTLDDEDDLI